MATQVQNRRGSTSEHSTFTGAVAEVTVDTDKDTVVVHDGTTAGGRPLLREDQSNLPTSAPTTGIYNNSGALALSTNGTGRLFVDASGRVGIGTQSPAAPLTVAEQGVGGASIFRFVGNAVNNNFMRGSWYASDNTTQLARINVDGTSSMSLGTASSTPLWILTDNTERLRITSDGKVGLGTSAPGANLDLVDGGTFSGIRVANLTTDATTKVGHFTGRHYTNTEESVLGLRIVSGSSDNSVILGGGSGDFNAATNIQFYTAASSTTTVGTLRMIINSSGRVGIGDNGPDSTLTVKAATGVTPFKVSGPSSEFAKIDSSGRLLVGTSSALNTIRLGGGATTTPQVQVVGSTFETAATSIIRTTTASPYFTLGSGSSGNNVVADSGLGTINFVGYDGSTYPTAALIQAQVDGTPGANDMPGRLVFSTTADGASSPTERMRITSAGDVFIGGTGFFGSNNNKGLGIQFSSATSNGGEGGAEIYNSSTSANSSANPPLIIIKGVNDTTSSNRFVQFYANGTTAMGGIVGNGASNVQFATLSDIRDKENLSPLEGVIDKIKSLDVVSFDWKNGSGHVSAGFIAQNVETVFPEYVIDNISDSEDEPRKGITGGMSAGYIAVLTAALQEAVVKIETLEAKVAVLEAS